MGRRGRHPDPNSKRSQAALARAAALGKTATPPPPKPVKASKTPTPVDVKARPLAAAFWAAHAGPLGAAGRLRPEHAAAMALLAHLHADCHELREQVAAEGRITATGKGQGVSPAARLLREARADFLTACREFGLTPASETRFPAEAVHDGEAEDPDRAALRAFGLTG